jgi:hypothetical protein
VVLPAHVQRAIFPLHTQEFVVKRTKVIKSCEPGSLVEASRLQYRPELRDECIVPIRYACVLLRYKTSPAHRSEVAHAVAIPLAATTKTGLGLSKCVHSQSSLLPRGGSCSYQRLQRLETCCPVLDGTSRDSWYLNISARAQFRQKRIDVKCNVKRNVPSPQHVRGCRDQWFPDLLPETLSQCRNTKEERLSE